MENKKIKNFSLKLTADRNDYMSAFRKNLFTCLEEKDITLNSLAEKADIPFSTLRTFLYGDATDCKLSTAVKLARALEVSVDELIGAETIPALSKESIALCRELPDYVVYLIRSFIRHQHKIHSQFDEGTTNIPVLLPECHNGYLQTTNITDTVCIDHLTNGLKSRICLGLKVPCEHYEPFYMPNEIILLAADRDGQHNEQVVVSYKGNIFLARKIFYTEDGVKKWKYVSLLDGKTTILPNEIDDKIGYVVGYLNPDGSWGIR